MSDKNVKFEAYCYLQGSGSWRIKVYDGNWGCNDGVYTVVVKSGIYGNEEVTNKTFRFPVITTIIEENKA